MIPYPLRSTTLLVFIDTASTIARNLRARLHAALARSADGLPKAVKRVNEADLIFNFGVGP